VCTVGARTGVQLFALGLCLLLLGLLCCYVAAASGRGGSTSYKRPPPIVWDRARGVSRSGGLAASFWQATRARAAGHSFPPCQGPSVGVHVQLWPPGVAPWLTVFSAATCSVAVQQDSVLCVGWSGASACSAGLAQSHDAF